MAIEINEEALRVQMEMMGRLRAGTFPGGDGRVIGNMTTPLDTGAKAPDDRAMSEITRPELDSRFKESEAKNAASEAKVDARLANFDTSIKTGFADLRTDFAKMQTEMVRHNGEFRIDMGTLRGEMHKNTSDLIKWASTLAFLAVGATVGLLTYINKASVEKVVASALSPPAANTQPTATPPTSPRPK